MTEEALFELALHMPEAERAGLWLAHPDLRERVLALLAAHEGMPNSRPDGATVTAVVDSAVTGQYRTASASAEAAAANVVVGGKYRLVEVIGEGGMGSVWRAQQTAPVQRAVALKLIKAGMDTKSVLARFEAERQALALMDHPNIAKVLDGGVHEGRPYFVMELVKGVPITEYCDHNKLTPPQRLALFVQVCQAIQHAHQKGIIHRDIKPSNVLIALYDDKPVVKVIDFGVAKATGGTLSEHTIDTGLGGVVGTPQYMSPEQATFNNLDIDTRSDVYALGVLLYELLTGTPPFSGAELKQKGLLEILRVVREDEPPRPSTKLSTADALPSISANRGTEPKKLTGLLRNELDWIVMKALEKDRGRRYETANGFAADVLRYLSGEAVQAHPPSRAYRLKKFVRRHKGQVLAASVIALTLITGIIGTTVGMVRAERAKQRESDRADGEAKAKMREAEQRLRAEENERRATTEKERAERNLVFAKTETAILGSVFESLNPKKIAEAERPLQDLLVENLLKAAKGLRVAELGDPLVVATMQMTLGVSLNALGESKTAIDLLNAAWKTRNDQLGADAPDTLLALNNLAGAYQHAGQVEQAIPKFKTAWELLEAKLGPNHEETINTMNNYIHALYEHGITEAEIPLAKKARERARAALGFNHEFTLHADNNLAIIYVALGQYQLALPILEELLALRCESQTEKHPDAIIARNNLGACLSHVGQIARSIELHEQTVKLGTKHLGRDHPITLAGINGLALGYKDTAQHHLALPLFEELRKLTEQKHGSDHPRTQVVINNLAAGYLDAGQPLKAIPLYEEALEKSERRYGQNNSMTANAIGNLGKAYVEGNRFDLAGKTLIRFLEVLRGAFPDQHPQFAAIQTEVSLDLLRAKQYASAEKVLRESLAIREKTQPEAWTTFNTMSLLGGALLGQKKYSDAEPLLLKGYEGMKTREAKIPPQGATRIPQALDRLLELYTATQKPDEVKKYQERRAKYPAAKDGKK